MGEENVERTEGGTPFETRVLRELANINQRFDGLGDRLSSLENRFDGLEEHLAGPEEKVDARLRETRPIWGAVLTRLERIEAKVDVFTRDRMDARTDIEWLKGRLPAV